MSFSFLELGDWSDCVLSSSCFCPCSGKDAWVIEGIGSTATGSIPISFGLQSILLSDESSEADSQSEDNEEEEEEELHLSREELHNMLRLHKYKKLHQNKYSKDKEVRECFRKISGFHAGYLAYC